MLQFYDVAMKFQHLNSNEVQGYVKICISHIWNHDHSTKIWHLKFFHLELFLWTYTIQVITDVIFATSQSLEIWRNHWITPSWMMQGVQVLVIQSTQSSMLVMLQCFPPDRYIWICCNNRQYGHGATHHKQLSFPEAQASLQHNQHHVQLFSWYNKPYLGSWSMELPTQHKL